MPDSSVDAHSMSPSDMLMIRLSIVVGGVLIALFMTGDLELIPRELAGTYITNRVLIQLPILCGLLVFTFFPQFHRYAQPAFLLMVLSLTYANYYLIHAAWEQAAFSFPYEGTLLYAYFGFFVLGMKFHYALTLMVVSSLGFIGLMLIDPVYGQLTVINTGFVVGSLFIGVIGRHRVDRLLGELEEANGKLITLSSVDGLTRLFNRRVLMTESERLFALMKRTDRRLAVFMIDLDHFKQFNDSYGHQEGDRAIRLQADIMRRVFRRQTDILGRYGGEEFMAVIEGSESGEFERQAAEVLKHWRNQALPNEASPDRRNLSCSIGICQGLANDFESVDDMIKRADEALYRAKNEGRARYVMV
ncbi:GGDEF domain-containing protein [Marinobacter sp. F3R08]|uniref:GGDEF domain-containing protein n=1 Tax=Marinobacter sp. F3R08 TaxID=2841559 RepID=UPI001C08D995|nr:GGDEF domain-containing protein [Marinobacter sp. F3R08]MBU2953745.1 GGDEF domain-containing protein [Marinobacter sp. F3R08]